MLTQFGIMLRPFERSQSFKKNRKSSIKKKVVTFNNSNALKANSEIQHDSPLVMKGEEEEEDNEYEAQNKALEQMMENDQREREEQTKVKKHNQESTVLLPTAQVPDQCLL